MHSEQVAFTVSDSGKVNICTALSYLRLQIIVHQSKMHAASRLQNMLLFPLCNTVFILLVRDTKWFPQSVLALQDLLAVRPYFPLKAVQP